jgi:hemolysin activation/secretion protein
MLIKQVRGALLWVSFLFIPALSWGAPGIASGAPDGIGGLPAGPGSSQDQFQRYQQRQQQLDMLPPPESDTQFITAPHIKNPTHICVPIANVTIENAPHLSAIERRTVMARYGGRCLMVADLNHALDDINGAYLVQGYVTSRAYLPEQSLRDGTLRIVVIEGAIDGFAFSGISSRWHQDAAFPGLKGHILNLRDLEQGLDQMNRLPSWSAKMQIVPGDRPGTSAVKITQSPPEILHGQVWTDDNGQYETGHETGHAQLRADDPLGMLDMWSVEYDHSLVGSAGQRGTQYISANGAVPYGLWTLSGGWWMSDDVYHLQTLNQDYRLAGRRKDFRIGLSRVVARNRVGVTTLQAGYELKSFLSTLDHTQLYTQSARQASVSVQGTESLKAWSGIWYITLGMQFYVGDVGTHSSITQPGAGDPHTRYVKPTLDIDGYKPLPGGVLWHTSVHGEYSTRDQFSTQQLQIGGPYTVRGFLSQMLLGNDGIYLRNDFSWTLAHPGMARHCGIYIGICRSFVEGAELYAIFDVGMTRAGYRSATLPSALRGGNIAGSGVGFRKSSGVLFWDASATHAVARGPLPAEGWIAAFRVGVRF